MIVNRLVAERSLEEGDTLPPASAKNRTVEFFNNNKRVGVIDCRCLLEFKAGMRNVRRAKKDLDDVPVACAEATSYSQESVSKAQQDALEVYEEEKEKISKIGCGSRRKKRGMTGKSPAAISRQGGTSKVAAKMSKEVEVVGGHSRDGRLRSRSRGAPSTTDGMMPPKKRKWMVLQNKIEPVANVAVKAVAEEKKTKTEMVSANGGKALAFLNGALAAFCSVHGTSEMRKDDTRLVEEVKIRIDVGRAGLSPLAMEQDMSLKELLAGKKEIGTIGNTGSAKKNTVVEVKEGSDCDGNVKMNDAGESGKHHSEQRSRISSTSAKTFGKPTSNQNGGKNGDNKK